jgi:hypothetical protein
MREIASWLVKGNVKYIRECVDLKIHDVKGVKEKSILKWSVKINLHAV